MLPRNHQRRLVDLVKNHIAPVIKNMIEKDPLQRRHVLRGEGSSEAMGVLEGGRVLAVVEIE
ncbi:hypothetical protein D3C85_1469080 [compost metagenome]